MVSPLSFANAMNLAADELAAEYDLRTTIVRSTSPGRSPGQVARSSADGARVARGSQLVPSTKATGVPFATLAATRSASQLVRRTQPCDSALEIFSGEGVP